MIAGDPKEKKVKQNFWLEKDYSEQLDELAAKKDMNKSQLLRLFVIDGLRQNDAKTDYIFEMLHDISERLKRGNELSASAIVAAAMCEAGRLYGTTDDAKYRITVKGHVAQAIEIGAKVDAAHADGQFGS